MTDTEQNATPPGDIAKWYTRARRFPQLIGKTFEGTKIWGGPYTYTQAIVGPAFAVAGYKTMWLWGRFDLLGNAVILLGATIGLVALLGKMPIGCRNPLSIAAGALRALGSPSLGRHAGAPLRPRLAHRCRGKVLAIQDAPTLAELQEAHSPARRHARPTLRTRRILAWGRRPTQTRPTEPPKLRPTPADTRPRSQPAPALTGVQRALAAAGQHHQEN